MGQDPTAPDGPSQAAARPQQVVARRYRLLQPLKAGGMGSVYVAEHLATGRRVALKLMHPGLVTNQAARQRFETEARAGAAIQSRHVVDVLDAGVDDATQVPFLVMELLSGWDLADLLRLRGRLPLGEVVHYLGQAARALDRAHAQGIVHRDLKPENLFLTNVPDEPPVIKVLDFGIAKLLHELAATLTHHPTGTPLYMAPEQAGDASGISPATDIWALGLVAYDLLVGRDYWEAVTVQELYGAILTRPLEPPSTAAARFEVELPSGFDAWFFGCVHRDPRGRFPSAGQAVAALSALQEASARPAAQPRQPNPAVGPSPAVPAAPSYGASRALAPNGTRPAPPWPGTDAAGLPAPAATGAATTGTALPATARTTSTGSVASTSRGTGSWLAMGALGLGGLIAIVGALGMLGAFFVVAYQQGWFTDDEGEPEGHPARPTSTPVAPAVQPEPQPETPPSPAAHEPPLPGMLVRYRSPSDCPGTHWVQVGVPAAATPDSYEFPLTQKVVAGRRTLAGSCFVMARSSSGQRIFGGVVSNESTGRLLQKLLDDELGPSGRSVQTRAGIQPIYGTFFVDEGGAVRSFAVQ